MADVRDPRFTFQPADLSGNTVPFAGDARVSREIVVTPSGAAEGLAPGVVVGDWRIDGKIGQGGMGSVHAATHPVIGKRAAIKVVHAELCRTAQTAERFVQEARVVNQICHPNIVDIFDIGQLDDGRPFLVMELLHGQTLGDRMDQGRMSPLDAIHVLLQVADAVAAAHAHGVVHRDLKPDNIYLTVGPAGLVVKVVDWGIAKLRDTTPQSVALTTSGVILGTPRYVSPEQARGKHLDERTDIYSLGVIAYEMFLEGPPFVADNAAELVAMHLREPPPPPGELWPDIPPALERLLLAMLAKDAAARPTLGEVIASLREVRDELVTRAAVRVSGRRLAAGSLPPPTGPAAAPALLAPAPAPAPAPEVADPAASALAVPARVSGTVTATVPPRRARWRWLAAALVVVGAGVIGLQLVDRGPTTTAATTPAPGEPAAPPGPAVPVTPEVPAVGSASSMVAAPAPAISIEIRTTPPTARVFVDDRRIPAVDGRRVSAIAAGTHEIRVEAPGHEPYRRAIAVDATTVLEVNLRRLSRTSRPRPRPEPAKPLDPNATIEPF